MDNQEKPIYERLAKEPGVWYARFLLFRNMPAAKRELLAAARRYQGQTIKGDYKPYKTTPGAWKTIADKWQWQARAEAYDAMLQAEAEARAEALREIEAEEERIILTTGYALKYKRVQALSEQIDLIKKSFLDEKTNKIEYRFVTPDKIRELRGCLADIAKEMGERVQKNELTGKDGGAIQVDIITEWGGGALDEDKD